MPLNAKQQRFCQEYIIDLNATQAAIRAGYSEKTARSQGQRLLTHVDAGAEIERLKAKVAGKLEITVERVLQELAILGFTDMADYMTLRNGRTHINWSELPEGATKAIQEITQEVVVGKDGEREVLKTKFKLYDKRAALVDIGRHLAMFTDKHLHGGDEENPLFLMLRAINGSSRAVPAGR